MLIPAPHRKRELAVTSQKVKKSSDTAASKEMYVLPNKLGNPTCKLCANNHRATHPGRWRRVVQDNPHAFRIPPTPTSKPLYLGRDRKARHEPEEGAHTQLEALYGAMQWCERPLGIEVT